MIILLDPNSPPADSVVTTADKHDATHTTTRLHWWAGNYSVVVAPGAFVNSSDRCSVETTAPRPREEPFHIYATYLLE